MLETTKKSIIEHKFALIFLLVLIFVALFTFKNYGVSWDERISRNNGEVTYRYLFKHDDTLKTYPDRDYGVAIELPLFLGERLLSLDEPQDMYGFRHLATHLLFLAGGYFFYLLCRHAFGKQWIALLGFVLFILCPVIYNHSFYNSKDIGFLSLFTISLYFILVSINKNTIRSIVPAAVFTALLINVRIVGVLLLGIYIFMEVLLLISRRDFKIHLLRIVFFLVISTAVLLVSWPYLWENPIGNFVTAFNNMKQFRWDSDVLYMGELVRSTALPWHYPLVWFFISIPVIYGLFGLSGNCFAIRDLIKHGFWKKNLDTWDQKQKRTLAGLAAMMVFWGTFFSFMILRTVLYDGWRHFFYVYPSFIILILFFIDGIQIKRIPGVLSIVILATNTVLTLAVMIANFPNNQVYLNEVFFPIQGNTRRGLFETDYWGNSNLQALEHIVAHDDRQNIKILFQGAPGLNNVDILPAAHRSRITILTPETASEADYFITHFRQHPDFFTEYGTPFYEVKAYGTTINAVYKLRH